MGRKKKNARHSVHGRKIHVNKYINRRGKTKKCRKSAVFWQPAQKESSGSTVSRCFLYVSQVIMIVAP